MEFSITALKHDFPKAKQILKLRASGPFVIRGSCGLKVDIKSHEIVEVWETGNTSDMAGSIVSHHLGASNIFNGDLPQVIAEIKAHCAPLEPPPPPSPPKSRFELIFDDLDY